MENSSPLSQSSIEASTVTSKSNVVWRLYQNKVAFFSFCFIAVVHIIVFAMPLFWPYQPEELTGSGALASWSWMHPFGTDELVGMCLRDFCTVDV